MGVKTFSLLKCMADFSSSSPCPLKMFGFVLFYFFFLKPTSKSGMRFNVDCSRIIAFKVLFSQLC